MQLLELIPLARDSVSDPRAGFRRLQRLGLDAPDIWQALVGLIALSVVVGEIGIRLLPAPAPGEGEFGILLSPFGAALFQFAVLAILAIAIHWGGRMLGGRGRFEDSLLAVTWTVFVLFCLQVVQVLSVLVLPFLASLLGLAGLVLTFWLLSGFVAELHGFRSRGRVFAGILIGLLGLSMCLALVLALIGIGLPGASDV